jgi:hypothetical protein
MGQTGQPNEMNMSTLCFRDCAGLLTAGAVFWGRFIRCQRGRAALG